MANPAATELDEFEKWCAERGHYTAAPLIQNFRNYKVRMKELEHVAQLRQAGQAHEMPQTSRQGR